MRDVRIKVPGPDEPFTVPVGKAEVARSGEDVTAIAYGLMFHETLKAAEGLANQGVSVEVIDLRTLHPLDKETILITPYFLRFALNGSDIWQPK